MQTHDRDANRTLDCDRRRLWNKLCTLVNGESCSLFTWDRIGVTFLVVRDWLFNSEKCSFLF